MGRRGARCGADGRLDAVAGAARLRVRLAAALVAALVALLATTAFAAEAQAAACPSGSQYSSAVMGTTGLAGYWRLDDSTALTACDGLNLNPGTYTSGVTVGQTGALAGDADTAARFNGSTGKVSVPAATSLNTADTFSIEAWVKRASTGTAQVIATKQGSSWTLLFNASNALVLQSNTTNVATSTTTVTDTTTWHHVVATKSGTAVKLYIDGKDVTPTKTSNAAMANNTLAVLIGGGASTSFFNGTIDDVALYRNVLSAGQVSNHFLLSRAPCPATGPYASTITQTANLVGYWRLDDRSGTTACETSGRYPGSYAGTYALGQPGAIAGDSNAAVRFDTSASVSVPALPALDVGDTLTVEAWVKRGTIGGTASQVIAAKQDQSWVLQFNAGNQLVLRQANVGDIAASTSTLTDTTGWHHVAATKSGSAVRLYIDGRDVTGSVTNRTLANNTQPLAIGQSGATAYFKGSIDEVAVYRAVLTPSQISGHWGIAQPAPAAPSALSATAASSSKIDLRWTDNSSNETGFVVERSSDSSFSSPQATTLPAGATSWSDTGLTASTAYWYRVKAVNGVVSSAFTSGASATTKQPEPAPPTGLEATAVSESRINIAWKDNSANETAFVVERSTDSSFSATRTTTLPAETTRFSDTEVAAGTDYWYRAKAVNGDSDSQFAQMASRLTTAAAPTLDPCTPPATDRPLNRTDRPLERGLFCVGRREMWARSRLQPGCTGAPYAYGQFYPDTRHCGLGPESLAHARAVSFLRSHGGLSPRDTHWEVETVGSRRGLADITSETDVLSVFEVKRTSDWLRENPALQVASYVRALNGVGVSPNAQAGGFSTALGTFHDAFAVPDRSQPLCQLANGQQAWRFKVYVTQMVGYGVLAVFEQLVPCFDPERERPRVPVPVPVDPARVPERGDPVPKPTEPAPGEAPAPGSEPWRPAPGTELPKPPVVTPGPPVPTPTPAPTGGGGRGGGAGGMNGDPHLETLDGLGYDFQAVGEFALVQADRFGLDIQARLTPVGSASFIDALAFNLNGYQVEVSGTASSLWLDGAPAYLPVGMMLDLGNGAFLMHDSSSYTAVWPGSGERPEMRIDNRRNLTLSVPPGSDTRGLLGNADGISSNDLVTGSGTPLPATATPAVLHGTFADSWRIENDESMFSYAPDESTDTFTDRSFPPTILKIQDFDDATLAEATAQCTNAGVVDGRQFDDCVIDWAVTRDTTFLDSAATRVTPITEGGARKTGPDGTVRENFEAAIAPNFSAARYGSGAGTGTFAGPLSRDGRYVFYVPEVPAHLDATVTLDVITLGSWTFLDNNPVTIDVNGQTAWSGNIAAGTPSSTGTTPSGQPYAVYPVTVTVPHTADQLNVGVAAELPPASARAIAVDNVDVRFDVIPSQVFDVSLPATISNGSPGAGAGNLETRVSEDVYSFTTPSTKDFRVELWGCSSSLSWSQNLIWKLVSASSGAVVKTGYGCNPVTVADLPAGSYQVKITSPGNTGTYQLRLAQREAMPITLPTTIRDGVPVAGAGRLETPAVEDVYSFSTSSRKTWRLEFSECQAWLQWKIVDTDTDQEVRELRNVCQGTLVDLPAGNYELSVAVWSSGSGTYKLEVYEQPAPQTFDVTLPAMISDGVPSAGAGKLETQVSEDVYTFTTPSRKGFRIEFWSCSSSLSWSQNLAWSLVDAASGAEVRSGYGCSPVTVPDLPAGSYRLKVTSPDNTGTYKLRLAQREVVPITLPASISDGVPVSGAGRLETPAAEDVYSFSTSATKSWRFEFSQCQAWLQWKIVDTDTGQEVRELRNVCSGALVSDLPAGNYELSVAVWSSGSGTYKVEVYEQPPPQVFDVSLPATISDGVPSAGAGNLETQVSEDVYAFTTPSAKDFRVEFWSCSSSLSWSQNLAWTLVDAGSGALVQSGFGCNPVTIPDLAAGSYRLKITSPGNIGTYRLRLAQREVMPISLPASISDGVPAAGAGRLESPAAEDAYSFSTTSAKKFQFELSQCQAWLQWQLVNADTGVQVKSMKNICQGTLVDLPAGNYELSVSVWSSGSGTYKLDIYEQPAPQVFDVSLPATISDGVPAAGAGNLETQVSEDVYTFATPTRAGFRVEFWSCSSSLSWSQNLAWKLVDASSGTTVKTGSGCNPVTVADLPAGGYQLRVTSPANTGTYKLRLAQREVVPITLPASISDGIPVAGAGRLESPAAEDVYSFSTSSAMKIQFELSQCQAWLQWQLVNVDTGVEVRSVRNVCNGTLVDVPAGNYQLSVSVWSSGSGTYRLEVYEQPPPQTFDLSLPASISDGVPAAGAGKLETQVSEDVYTFTTPSAKDFRVEVWSCSSSVSSYLTWKLVDASSGTTVKTGSGCNPVTVADLPAGAYRLRVTAPGTTGTYKLRVAQREFVPITLPASISDGVPAAGAGRLDTPASEDVYTFSTAAAGSLQLTPSQCQAWLQWQLVNADTGTEVQSVRNTCSGTLVSSLPAGNYELVIAPWSGTGTYKFDVFKP